MTVPNRAKSVPSGTHGNLERGEILQGTYLTQEDRSRDTLLKRSDPLIAVLRERAPRSFFTPFIFPEARQGVTGQMETPSSGIELIPIYVSQSEI